MRTLWNRTPAVVIVCCLFGLLAGFLAVKQPTLAVALLGLGAVLALIARLEQAEKIAPTAEQAEAVAWQVRRADGALCGLSRNRL